MLEVLECHFCNKPSRFSQNKFVAVVIKRKAFFLAHDFNALHNPDLQDYGR